MGTQKDHKRERTSKSVQTKKVAYSNWKQEIDILKRSLKSMLRFSLVLCIMALSVDPACMVRLETINQDRFTWQELDPDNVDDF